MKKNNIFVVIGGIAAVCVVFGIGVVAGSAYFTNKSNVVENTLVQEAEQDVKNEPAAEMPQTENQISLDTAKEIACSDAGVALSDVTFTKEKLDKDDGILVYEIEFFTSEQKYEYEIHATTGEVYSKDIEGQKSGGAVTAPSEKDADIGAEQAKSTAADHAGFDVSELEFVKVESDYEDGTMVYEIEFYKDGMEYEYEIDAKTGAVLKYKSEWE